MSDYFPPDRIIPLEEADTSRPPPPLGPFSTRGTATYVTVNSASQSNTQHFQQPHTFPPPGSEWHPGRPTSWQGHQQGPSSSSYTPFSQPHESVNHWQGHQGWQGYPQGPSYSTHGQRPYQLLPPVPCLPPNQRPVSTTVSRVVDITEVEEAQAQAPIVLGWKDEAPVAIQPPLRRSARRAATPSCSSDTTTVEKDVLAPRKYGTKSKPAPQRDANIAAAPRKRSKVVEEPTDSEPEEEELVTPRNARQQAAVPSTSRQPSTLQKDILEPRNSGTKPKQAVQRDANNAAATRKTSKVVIESTDSESEEEEEVGGEQDPSQENDSESSMRDDLGRWMDGDDDLSSDFDQPKKKLSKANQLKKVTAAARKSRKKEDDQVSEDEDFEMEAKKQLKSRKGAKTLSLNKDNQKKGAAKRAQPEPKFPWACGDLPDLDPDIIFIDSEEEEEQAPAAEAFQSEGNKGKIKVKP